MIRNETGRRRQERLVDTWMRNLRSTHSPVARPPDFSTAAQAAPRDFDDDRTANDLREAILGFHRAASALKSVGEEAAMDTCETKFLFPLDEILRVLPAHYVSRSAEEAQPGCERVEIIADNLFDQLARGQVHVSVSKLVFGVPADMVRSEAFHDDITMISLPLPAVVASLEPGVLAKRTAHKKRSMEVESLPDPFDFSAATPAATPAEAGADPDEPATTVTEAAPRPLPAPVAPVPPLVPAVSVVETIPVAQPPAIPDLAASEQAPPPRHERPRTRAEKRRPVATETPSEWLSGVNLNTATAEQLLGLKGVSPLVAESIIAYRNAHGPFENVFGLAHVPRVGRKTFRKITGMPYSRTGRHRLLNLASLLKLPDDAAGRLPAVVRASAAVRGVTGCLVSDRDGLVLSESGIGNPSGALAAIVPRLAGQMAENMREVDGGDVRSVSVCVGTRMYTIITGGRIYLTALHGSSRVTTAQIKVLRRVALELDWLLSYRGYVPGPAPGRRAEGDTCSTPTGSRNA